MARQAANILRPGEGRTDRVGGLTMAFRHDLEGEAGGFSLCQATPQPGSGAGIHRHDHAEWAIAIEGEFECLPDGRRSAGPATSLAAVRIGSGRTGPRWAGDLLSLLPGIVAGFISEVDAAQADIGSPYRPGGTPDFRAIAQKYGIEFIVD